MASEKFTFTGSDGSELAARLDLPTGAPRAYALFAHCFTCTKDIFAASSIAEGLTAAGIAVLRFDFTGLGHSQGEFANANFSSNVADLVCAADVLRQNRQAPQIMIGHSLGGAAVLAAAGEVPECRAVATVGAPFDPGHVAHLFADAAAEIDRAGEAEVDIAGRRFTIRKQFLEDIAAQPQRERIAGLRRALLVLHGPRDEIVGIDNASEIFLAAKHPKSFVSLDDADHLLTRKADAVYVAEVLASWASRYLEPLAAAAQPPQAKPGTVVVQETGEGLFTTAIAAGPHALRADEPVSYGGDDSGPTPYDLLLAGLGACTTMTLRLYARRKKWPLERARVSLRHEKIHAEDCAECETREGRVDHIDREITLEGPLDAEQRDALLAIADRCPVHRTLHSEVKIDSRLVGG